MKGLLRLLPLALLAACDADTAPSPDVADTLGPDLVDAADVADTDDVADVDDAGPGPDIAPPATARLVINEIGCRADPVEWVEVKNIGDAPADLGGMRIADTPRARGTTLPAGLLAPGAWLVVQGDLGLGCGADKVYLMQLSRVVDVAGPTGGDAEIASWGRIPDGTGPFVETAPTPRKANRSLEDERASVFSGDGSMPIVDLYVDPAAEETLMRPDKTYAPGLFTWTDDAGTSPPLRIDIRIKGSITFRPWNLKPSLKLHFARHDDPGPRHFRGLKKLALHNLAYDPSGIREWLAYSLMRQLGQPAPRVGWAVVRVNGESKGLYGVVETYDERFLADHFPSTEALYEADGDFGFGLYGFALDEGTSMAPLEELATRVVAVRDGGGDATAELPEVDWLAVARMMAHEDLLQHSDGMMAGCHNWFAHVDDAGRWSAMPWSADLVLITAWGVTGPLNACSAFANLCLRDEVCHAWFLRARDEAARLALRGTFRADASRLAARAQEHARPTDEPWSSNEFWQQMPFDLVQDAQATIDLLELRARGIRCASAVAQGEPAPTDDPQCGGFLGTGGGKPVGPKEN